MMDALLTPEEIKVLDHGYVKYVDHMGSDRSVIEAARMSTAKGFLGWDPDPTIEGHKGDANLLRYLWENKHSTPFEFCQLALEVQLPIFVMREWVRHRTQSFNEMSARYVKMPDLHYVPSQDRVQKQSKTNKQGSGETVGGQDAEFFRNQIAKQQEGIYSYYEDFCKNGIALELVRINTPVSRYTRMRCTTNLRNWFGFLSLRASPAAQWEIQEYARAVSKIVKAMFPRSYALWEEGQASETFSKAEVRTLLDNIAEPDHLPEKLRKKLGL